MTNAKKHLSLLLAVVIAVLGCNFVSAADNTVSFILTGDSVHAEGEHSAYETWVDTVTSFDSGDTVDTVMQKVLKDCGYDIGYSYGYLDSITSPGAISLGSGTNGNYSGWMYKVNDLIPDVGMSEYTPNPGDRIEVFYCDDFMAEIYGYTLTVNSSPESINIEIFDSLGNKVEKSPWGDYYALIYGDYTYLASCDGYNSVSGAFTVNTPTPTLDITLEAVAPSTEITTENSGNSSSLVKWATKLNIGWSGFSGIVVDSDYIYNVADNKLRKLDKNGNILLTAETALPIGYNYYLGEYGDNIFVQLSDGRIQAFGKDDLSSLWISAAPTYSGLQGISPIYCDGTNIYAATLSTKPENGYGSLMCMSLTDPDESTALETKPFSWEFIPQEHSSYSGFYWTSVAPVGSGYIAIGSEGGYLYVLNKNTGNVVSSLKITEGNIRSTPVCYNGYIYITTTDGNINRIEVNTYNGELGTQKSLKIAEGAVSSTSKPVIYNGKIYVGANGEGYDSGFISVIDSELNNVIYTYNTLGAVTAAPVYGVTDTGINVFFAVNSSSGTLYKLTDEGEITCNPYFDPTGDFEQYCIHTPVIDYDTLYYQNDSGYLIALKYGNTSWEEVTESTTQTPIEVTTKRHTSSGGGGGVGSSSSYISITASVVGDNPHEEGKHTGYVYWVTKKSYTVKKGTNASDFLEKLFSDNGISCVGLDNGYVSSVTSADGVTLAEFDNGKNSGWVYAVNDSQPAKALKDYVFSSGDDFVFCYVDDYTKETGASKVKSSSSSYSDEETTVTTKSTLEETTESTTNENITEDENDIILDGIESNNDFDDVPPSHYAYNSIEHLRELSIVSGMGENNFEPSKKVTRAQLVTMLYKASGDEGKYSFDFNDVEKDAWYFESISWAAEKGIVSGVGNNNFAPDRPVTREESARICFGFAKAYNKDVSSVRTYVPFGDEDDIIYKESVQALYEAEIINGMPNGSFEPKSGITRADCAIIVDGII
ncbi:MAG TPA: hypothetical protein DCG28_03415 [Lachnospiraceae bacterium]|nr:hypothetical protein [Lachnospiraceae bacterium]